MAAPKTLVVALKNHTNAGIPIAFDAALNREGVRQVEVDRDLGIPVPVEFHVGVDVLGQVVSAMPMPWPRKGECAPAVTMPAFWPSTRTSAPIKGAPLGQASP